MFRFRRSREDNDNSNMRGHEAYTENIFKPGVITPRSGLYDLQDQNGTWTGYQATSTAGNPLPPTQQTGQGWVLHTAAIHKGKKK